MYCKINDLSYSQNSSIPQQKNSNLQQKIFKSSSENLQFFREESPILSQIIFNYSEKNLRFSLSKFSILREKSPILSQKIFKSYCCIKYHSGNKNSAILSGVITLKSVSGYALVNVFVTVAFLRGFHFISYA